MNVFEITVQRKWADAWPVVVEHSRTGVFLPVRTEGVLKLELVELLRQVDPKDYGTVLGEALFHDQIRDAFMRTHAGSDDYLRVLLFIEADDLKTLRWERLCAPLDGHWDFLALDQRVPFSLYLPSVVDRRFPPIGRRDLRLLLVVARPEGLEKFRLDDFDVEAAVSSVRTALGEIPCDVLATVEGAIGPPTLDRLSERITAEQYTLLHFVCHGRYTRESGETILYLTDKDNQVDPVDGTRLLERLRQLRGARGLPHFTFLGTCETASPEAEGVLGGLAQRLVRELGMPAVIAMTEKVSVETAQGLAEGFYRQLSEHGEVDRALVEALAGLAERYDSTVPVLYSRLAGRPLFSDTLDRPLTNEDTTFGLDRMEELLPERVPVLQERFNRLAEVLRATLGTAPEALSETARDERRTALAEVNQLCEEALDLTFNALAFGEEPPDYDFRCPFRGLEHFGVEHAEFFFGRKKLVDCVEDMLAERQFLTVSGPSGSGKSSLVLGGLIPALQAEEPGLELAYMTPGSDPLSQLEASLSQIRDQSAVLVVDQFEELFTIRTEAERRQAFVERLLSIREQLRVVITMRADFWTECAQYPELMEVMQGNHKSIAPLGTAELRRSMERQVAQVGLRFEADLGNTIMDDVQGEPGAMPLLQHLLLELWNRRHGRWLRIEEYRAIGGVQQAIASTADDVYDELSSDEQDRMRDILVRLTRLDEEALPGEEPRDTRRRVEVEELMPAGSDPTETTDLVTRLAEARLVVTSLNKATGREELEMAHEALIRYWPQLEDWLGDDRPALLTLRRLTRQAQQWDRLDRDSGLLYRGAQLDVAQRWSSKHGRKMNNLERHFLAASQRRADMIGYAQMLGLAVLVVLASVPPIQWTREALRRRAASAPMATFKAGPAWFGSDDEPTSRAYPERREELPAFSMDKNEVTYKQYRLCVIAKRCSPPREPADASGFEQAGAQLPVVWVDAYQAAEFCRWIGRRLPSEQEWERAARGTDGRPWPWGTEPPTRARAKLILPGSPPDAPVAVDDPAFAAGATPNIDDEGGITHLLGNVWEWTRTSNVCRDKPYDCQELWDGEDKVQALYLRGLAWSHDLRPITYALPADPVFPREDTGFRCARPETSRR